MNNKLLIPYYSLNGGTYILAKEIAKGVEKVKGCEAVIRKIPPVNGETQLYTLDQDVPFVTQQNFEECHGLALGTPTRFGGMASPVKFFLEKTRSNMKENILYDKPAFVFTSSAHRLSGAESNLHALSIPLMNLGVMLLNIPFNDEVYNDEDMENPDGSFSPIEIFHSSAQYHEPEPTENECIIAFKQGEKLARIVKKLAS